MCCTHLEFTLLLQPRLSLCQRRQCAFQVLLLRFNAVPLSLILLHALLSQLQHAACFFALSHRLLRLCGHCRRFSKLLFQARQRFSAAKLLAGLRLCSGDTPTSTLNCSLRLRQRAHCRLWRGHDLRAKLLGLVLGLRDGGLRGCAAVCHIQGFSLGVPNRRAQVLLLLQHRRETQL